MIENIKARLFAKRFNILKEEIDANDKEGYFIYNKQIYFGNRFFVFIKSNQILFRLEVEEENKRIMEDKHLERALKNTYPKVVDVYITMENGDELRVFKKADDIQMEKQEEDKTVVELLFLEFKTLATNMRFAGDESGAGLIDFLCEREVDALREEQEQIQKAYEKGISDANKLTDEENKFPS